MNSKWNRRVLPFLIAICLLLPATLLAAAAPPAPDAANTLTATPLRVTSVVSGREPAAEPEAEAATEGEPWPYIIRLEGEPLATYRGGIPRLQATNPRALGQTRLDVDSQASQAYLDYLEDRQTQFIDQLQNTAGHPIETLHSYQTCSNGIAAMLTPDEAARVANMPGVASVDRDEPGQIETDVTPDFIGATSIWNGTAAGVDVGTKGEGVIVGVIDTGIWPEHPSFADDGTYPEPPGEWVCQQPDDGSPGYTCNNKLIGVKYFAGHSGRDHHGHGTHVASTAAGNENVNATLFGVDRGTISGIAPRAHLAVYKVGDSSFSRVAVLEAIDEACTDGVDIINYSGFLGALTGERPWNDTWNLALLAAREIGIFVTTSAGNKGPFPGMLTAPGHAPWLMAVGASTSNRHFISEITAAGPGSPPLGLWGASITDGVTEFNLVDAEGIPDSKGHDWGLCWAPFPEGTFETTDVVLCEYGDQGPLSRPTRVEHGANVAAGGGGGMILYNGDPAEITFPDNHVIPTVHVNTDVGIALKEYVNLHPDEVTVSFAHGAAVLAEDDPRVTADMIAISSSRGPNNPVLPVIKPDVTAPGVQILAGWSPEHSGANAQGQLFRVYSGTSMASPHVAGAAALLKALHPDWSPAMVQSALMTTALTEGVVKEDGETPADPFDMGSGRIDLTRAADPGLVFDETGDGYMVGQDDPANINLPSLGFGRVFGRKTITRTATSVLDHESTWTVSAEVDAPDGVEITVSPDPLVVPTGGIATFQVTVDAVGTLPEEPAWYFGDLTLTDGTHRVGMPIAFMGNFPSEHSSLDALETQWDAGQVRFDLRSAERVDPFVIKTYGLVDPTRTDGGPLHADPDGNPDTDPLGEGFELYPFTITDDMLWFVAQVHSPATQDSCCPNFSLHLLYDANGNGAFEWPDERIPDLSGRVEFGMMTPKPGDYLAVVYTWDRSGKYVLRTYEVTADSLAASLHVPDAPDRIAVGERYAMHVNWDHPIDPNEEYLGVVGLGTEDDPFAVSFVPVRIKGAAPAVRKTVHPQTVSTGRTVASTIVLANADPQESEMTLVDVIPSNLDVDPASITGGGTLADGVLAWSGTLPPRQPMEIVPTDDSLGYISLAGLGVPPIDADDTHLDPYSVNLAVDPVPYLGIEYDTVCMATDGYLVMGGCTQYPLTIPFVLPHSGPNNNVIAPLAMEFDLDGGDGVGGGTWYAGTVTQRNERWQVFEWENAQLWGWENTAFTFQVWLRQGDEQVTFTYDRLDGSLDSAVVGAEDADGTDGATYYNGNDPSGTPPAVGDVLEVSGGPSTHTITYSAQITGAGDVTNVATVTSGDNRDSASATVVQVPRGRYSLSGRVFLDFRCDAYFQSGLDSSLADVPITLSFSNGATLSRTTTSLGLFNFSGFDVANPVTVTVELPERYRGLMLDACPHDSPVVTLTSEDFRRFRTKFLTFGATVTGEGAGP